MATNLTEFVKIVTPHVTGCPESTAIKAIRDAINRLCEDSLIWRDDIPAGDIVIAVDDYTITPPVGTRMITIQSLMYDGKEIHKKTEDWLDKNDYGWRAGNTGDPSAIVQYGPDRIKLNRVPAATITDGLVPRVILKLSDDATTVDDMIYSDWRECVMHGALHALMQIPKKDWSDINLSVFHGKHFNFQIQRAKARARMGFSQQNLQVQIPSW